MNGEIAMAQARSQRILCCTGLVIVVLALGVLVTAVIGWSNCRRLGGESPCRAAVGDLLTEISLVLGDDFNLLHKMKTMPNNRAFNLRMLSCAAAQNLTGDHRH